MTLLVTGGAGFIGSNFIFYWIKNHPEDRVVCLDKLTYAGNRATLAPVLEHPSFRFVRGDICDREAVDRLFGDCLLYTSPWATTRPPSSRQSFWQYMAARFRSWRAATTVRPSPITSSMSWS